MPTQRFTGREAVIAKHLRAARASLEPG